MASCKPRRVSEERSPADAVTLDRQPPGQSNTFLLVKPLLCGAPGQLQPLTLPIARGQCPGPLERLPKPSLPSPDSHPKSRGVTSSRPLGGGTVSSPRQ